MPRVDRIAGHSFLARGLAPGATVIDGGANVGAFALPLARRYGVRVVCVEPLPALAAELRRRGLAEVVEAALAPAAGEVELATYRGTCPSLHRLQRDDRVESLRVPALTLEALARERAPSGIALLKLDIEGPESALLLGAPDALLAGIAQLTVEFHDFLDPALAPEVDRAVARLERLGFAVFAMSRDRSDLLFVNRRLLPLSAAERLYLRVPYRLLRGAADVEGLRGDVGVPGLQPREGAHRVDGECDVHRDDEPEGCDEACQHVPAGEAEFLADIGHQLTLPLKIVSLWARSPLVRSSTQKRNSVRSDSAGSEPFGATTKTFCR